MAGLGRKVFNSGDILLASEVQGYLQDQSVMVFDDNAARGSAIPTPSEGMVTYRKDDDALEFYDGAAFEPIGGSNDAGLIHIKQVSTGGAVSSVSVNDCFNADYNTYRIIFDLSSSTGNVLNIRLRVSGSDESSGIYGRQQMISSSTTVTAVRATTETSWLEVAQLVNNKVTNNSLEIINPFETVATSCHNFRITGSASTITAGIQARTIGNSTSYTGFTVFPDAGTIDGTISVLGYRK